MKSAPFNVAHIPRSLATPCVALAAALAAPAFAVTTLTITQETDKTGTQPADIQCVITGQSCPGGAQVMDYFNYPQAGGSTDRDIFSDPNTAGSNQVPLVTDYTVGYLASFGYTTFDVGIDVNTTQAKSETLTLFDVLINGVVQFHFDTSTNIGNYSFNGNGFSDWTLHTIDLTPYAASDIVTFHAVWSGDVDGYESYFLIQANPIPEPQTYALMLAGLGVMGLLARRRRVQE
jgi:hypothetical protein